MTTAEAARILDMTDSGIRRRISRGKLKAIKRGHDWIILSKDLNRK